MSLDELQKTWQSQGAGPRIDADLLLKEVQRNQRTFSAIILRRDVIEVGVALLLLPYWVYQGLTSSLPWTWWLTVPAILWIIGFFLVDRMRHPQTPSDPRESLLDCVKNSLTQVEHQIWLLRNVFWWYLLPFTISILAFFAHSSLRGARNSLEALAAGSLSFGFLLAIYAFIDYINQRAVRSDLEPRRQELFTLLASLGGDDATDEHALSLANSNSMSGAKSVRRSSVLRRWIIVAVVTFVTYVVMILLASGSSDSSYGGPPRSSGPAGDSLASLITDLRKEKNLVGLAAMVMVDGQIAAAAAHGERKIGSGVPVEIADRWHLGGITKSITATMIARLVEAGQMQWSDSLGEIFPDAAVHEEWKLVTIKELLTDTAGAPANFPGEVSRHRPPLGPESTQARREAVLNVIAEKPAYPPGEEYLYSNVGYTIAGAMAEKVTGANWEDLVKREVFEPLELTEAGFGPPTSGDDTLEQPRGHRTRLAGKVAVDDNADNTSIMGPSGIVHMSLRDLSTYAKEHLRGDLGEGQLLSAETYKLLHAREFGPYSCGWIRRLEGKERPYYAVYWHNGSNTMWYALVVFIPEKNMVVAVTSNDGDIEQAEAAAWEIVKASVTMGNSL
jgi:CubicO group peptidase (beta-lactamase class C family)